MDIKQIFLIVVIFGIIGFSVYYDQFISDNIQISDSIKFESSPYPEMVGSTDYGYVVRGGPYGNKDSDVKVAYIVGVHPLEYKSHMAILEILLNKKNSLKYSYYIYRIKVTRNASDYNEGRINGQLLAYKYVVPDIVAKKINLVVDVHSNRGVYKENRFLDVPVKDNISEDIAYQIMNKISWITFYIPPLENGPTSGPYVIIPLIKSGIPTIVYETYMYESYETTLKHADDLIDVIDQLNL